MTTTTLTPAARFSPRPFGNVPGLASRLAASFMWAHDVSRGLNSLKRLGRRVDDAAVRQIIAQADARNGLDA